MLIAIAEFLIGILSDVDSGRVPIKMRLDPSSRCRSGVNVVRFVLCDSDADLHIFTPHRNWKLALACITLASFMENRP